MPISQTQPPSTSIVPITLTQAVNEMLAAVGRGPITSVSDPQAIGDEEQKALAIINDACVDIQARGWWYNSLYEYIVTPNPVDGSIALPLNTLTARENTRFFPKQARGQYDRYRTFTMNYVNGKPYLYDMANNSYAWINGTDGTIAPQPLVQGALGVELIIAYAFEDIPQPIRWFITCRAGRDFATGRVPDMNTYRFGDAVLTDAEATANNFDREMRPQTPAVNPHFHNMRRR